jgi:lantibiotic modifying enzyme
VELWHATGEARFRETAWRLLEFERGCYDPARGNWRDFRDAEPRFDSVWCHGSGGIALSRMHIWRRTGDARCLEEAWIALADVRAWLPRLQNFSLCHGMAGCADILIEAARVFGDTSFMADAEAAAQLGIECYFAPRRTWPGGMVRTVETPDLMWGLAGIAWFYLRMSGASDAPTALVPGAII